MNDVPKFECCEHCWDGLDNNAGEVCKDIRDDPTRSHHCKPCPFAGCSTGQRRVDQQEATP